MIMAFSSYLRYTFRDAFRSVGRHKGMAFASVLTIAISLFILGSTLLLVVNSQYLVSTMESQVEINVFLQLDLDRQDALALQKDFEKMPGFEDLEFISKEKALEIMQERFGKDTDILKALGGVNPFPDSYRIKVQSPEQVDTIAQEIEKLPEVESIRYGKELVDKLVAFTVWVKNFGLAVIIGMLIAGLFLITTTIRLTVFTRKKEINIMKYVGAANWFIRFPFFLEGMLIGFLGAVTAGVIIYFGYSVTIQYVIKSIPFFPIVADYSILYRIVGVLTLGGTVIGALGSVIAIRKYLKV